jgi:hypothetical protein
MNSIEDVMKLTKAQLRALSEKGLARVKAILEKEIEKIMQRNKK